MAPLKMCDNGVRVMYFKKNWGWAWSIYDTSQQLIVGLFAPPKLLLLNAQEPPLPAPKKPKKQGLHISS